MAINSLLEYIPARNKFINERLGPNPYQVWENQGGAGDFRGSAPPQEVQAAGQQWQQQYDQLAQQFDSMLPPQDLAAIQAEKVRSAAKDQSRFDRGAMATKLMIGGIAGAGLAPLAMGAMGAGGAGAVGAGAAGTSALESSLIAGGMSATEAASVAAEVAAATAAEGGVASGVGLGAGAGGTAAGAAAGQAAMTGGASTIEQLAAKYGPQVGQALQQYGPNALKLAGAALPLLAGTGAGGGGGGSGGSGGGSGGTSSKGMMAGGVLGANGIMGSPQEMQAQSNQLAQTRADWANRPNQTDMYGNQTQWSSEAVLDPATGQMVNKWSNKIVLDPQQQQAVDSEKAIKAGMMSNAQGLMGRVGESFAQPMDYSKFQEWGKTPQGDDQARQRMEAMLMERMAPEYKRQQAGLEAQLGGMGLTRGSDPWNQEMQRLQDQQSRGKFDAFQTAGNEMQNQYSRELQSSNYQNQLRGSQIGEATTQRMQPLTEMNALRQGNQVESPQFGKFGSSNSAGGVDYGTQYANADAASNARYASNASALTNIGTTLGSMYFNQPQQYSAQQPPPGMMNGGYNAQTGQPRRP